MNIRKVTVTNFRKIEVVKVTPTGTVVQIAGANGQGKTSLGLAILYALGGKKALAKALGLSKAPSDDEIIRRGARKAEVVIDLGEYHIKWQLDLEKGERVEIRSAGGGRYNRTKLAELTGAFAFDPLAIRRLPGEEQARTLLEIAGVDFGDVDGRLSRVYQQRREANSRAAAAQGMIGDPTEGAPSELVDIGALEGQLENATNHIAENKAKRSEAVTLATRASELADDVDVASKAAEGVFARAEALPARQEQELLALEASHVAALGEMHHQHQRELSDSEARLVKERSFLVRTTDRAKSAEEAAGAAREAASKLADPDLESLREAVNDAREANTSYRLEQARAKRQQHAGELTAKADGLHQELLAIRAEKTRLRADATMPLEGLGVAEDGLSVTWDGHPLNQEAESSQIQICTAIAAAGSPKLKIAWIRDGDKLDKDSYAAFVEICERLGLQPWIERCEPVGGDAIVIEEGRVKSSEGQP